MTSPFVAAARHADTCRRPATRTTIRWLGMIRPGAQAACGDTATVQEKQRVFDRIDFRAPAEAQPIERKRITASRKLRVAMELPPQRGRDRARLAAADRLALAAHHRH